MIDDILRDLQQQFPTLGHDVTTVHQWEQNVGYWLCQVRGDKEYREWVARMAITVQAHWQLSIQWCLSYIEECVNAASTGRIKPCTRTDD